MATNYKGYSEKILQLASEAMQFQDIEKFAMAMMKKFGMSKFNPTLSNMIANAWLKAQKNKGLETP